MKNEGAGEKNKMGKEEGEITSKTGNAKKTPLLGYKIWNMLSSRGKMSLKGGGRGVLHMIKCKINTHIEKKRLMSFDKISYSPDICLVG